MQSLQTVLIVTSLANILWVTQASSICSKWGQTCRDDQSLVFCYMKDSKWMETEIMKCENSSRCDKKTGTCTTAHLVGRRFDCQSEGIFPDPYQCGTFYTCYWKDNTSLQKIFVRCPQGKFYDVETNICSAKEFQTTSSCPRYFQCDYPGQIGIWPGNTNIYYVCAVNPDKDNPDQTNERFLYPKVFRCPENEIFNGTQCVDRKPDFCAPLARRIFDPLH